MPEKMHALWLEDQKISFRRDVPRPVPDQETALIRVLIAGICATDLEMVKGYYPFTGVPGHEFVGIVESAPAGPAWVGKRVVGEINISCGQCPPCRRGDQTHCQQRKILGMKKNGGTFAEFLTLPLRNLYQIPDSVSNEEAVFVEPLAAAYEILVQVSIQAADRVLVIGAGRLGQLIAQVVATTGCHLQVVTRHEFQREILENRGIATLEEGQIRGNNYDFVVEATGSSDGFSIAQTAVRPRGTIILKSTYAGEMQVNFSSIVVDEIQVVGSRCGPFAPALKLLQQKIVDPTPLISDQFQLQDGIQAFARAAQPGVLKVLLAP